MTSAAARRWADAFAIYGDRRVLAVLLLGFSSGLPLAMTGATLAVWLTETNVSMASVGLFALVGTPYTFKFLWAPLIDRLPIPGMTRFFGRRRGWMLTTQAALIAALLGLGSTDPAVDLELTALFAVIVAFCSASQDIVIDAWRVEILDDDKQGAGAAAVQFGYRIAMLATGAGALFLAEVVPWFMVYAAAAALVCVGVVTVLLNPEPAGQPELVAGRPTDPWGRRLALWAKGALVEPFSDMVVRHGAVVLAILAFILLYKLGDAMAGVMANPFYIKIGFTKPEIASISKVFGFIATVVGTILGGVLVARWGAFRALMVCGVLQMGSNLMFAAQAMVGHDLSMLTATIAIENLSGGMGSAAFVAYISRLCNVNYTGTQYALLSSLAAVGRTLLSSSSGVLVENLGWVDFFLASTAAALPGLILLWVLRHRMGEPHKARDVKA